MKPLILSPVLGVSFGSHNPWLDFLAFTLHTGTHEDLKVPDILIFVSVPTAHAQCLGPYLSFPLGVCGCLCVHRCSKLP